jgi:hypothetical protein
VHPGPGQGGAEHNCMVQRPARRRLAACAIVLLVGVACSPTRGCIESSFDLAAESPIPRWFEVPAGAARGDFSVQIDYWIGPRGRTATITLRSADGQRLDSVQATLAGLEPHTLLPKPDIGPIPYPSYEILTAKGITEVVEHRRMEPRFYLVEDLEVKRRLGVQ